MLFVFVIESQCVALAGLELASTSAGMKGVCHHCLALALFASYNMALES